jgi:hypothetical protein
VPFSFPVTASDLVAGSLNRPGTVRVDKIYALAQSIIVKKFGKMSPRIVQRIRETLESITQPTP